MGSPVPSSLSCWLLSDLAGFCRTRLCQNSPPWAWWHRQVYDLHFEQHPMANGGIHVFVREARGCACQYHSA